MYTTVIYIIVIIPLCSSFLHISVLVLYSDGIVDSLSVLNYNTHVKVLFFCLSPAFAMN